MAEGNSNRSGASAYELVQPTCFGSPDPLIKDATATQSLNRYSYVLNNPLIYTDPSGYADKPVDWNKGRAGAIWVNPYFNGVPTGAVGPGSGYHWSDQYRSPEGNFMLGNHRTVGNEAFDFFAGVYSGDIPTYTWNPIAGQEVYRETNGSFVNIYYSGDWTLSKPNLGAINGGNNLFGMAANGGDGNNFMDVSAKINRVTGDVITGTTGFVVGVQKLSNQVSKTYNVVKEIPVLRTLGKVTGAVNIAYNFNEFRQDPRGNWWNGVEAVGQTAFWIFGGAEANLIYNLSTMTIDLTIDAVDYFKSN